MENKLFEISDFAKLCGFTRQTLIYYDNIGLIHPYKILNNKYRMYSYSQVSEFTIIYMLRELGIPLKEIKNILNMIAPDTILNILENQMKEIDNKINKLRLIKDLLGIRIDQIKEGINNKDTLKMEIKNITADRYIYEGKEINTYHIDDDNLINFYSTAESLGIPTLCSEGVVIKKEDILNKNYGLVSKMFLSLNSKTYSTKKIPKGDFLVCYVKGDYGKTDYIYPSIYEYIEKNHLEIITDSYEEYLIDELATKDHNDFILKISIGVKKLD